MSRPDLVRERAARLGRPRVHLPGMVGRARADGLLLLLTALVVAVAALLAGLVPPAAGRAADRAADAVVAAAGDRATLTASKPLETLAEIESVGRAPDTAEIIDNALASTRQSLRPVLADVMQPSVASLVTEPLGVLTREAGRSVQLAYVASGPGDPRVVWTSGVAPRASVPVDRARDPVPFGVTWTV